MASRRRRGSQPHRCRSLSWPSSPPSEHKPQSSDPRRRSRRSSRRHLDICAAFTVYQIQTQSDVDSLLFKLHLHDADILLHIGVLTSSVSTSRAADFRVLLTRLQIGGGGDSRLHTMEALLQLLNDDEKNVTVAVGQGIVPVKLLDSSTGFAIKEKVVAVAMKEKVVAGEERERERWVMGGWVAAGKREEN